MGLCNDVVGYLLSLFIVVFVVARWLIAKLMCLRLDCYNLACLVGDFLLDCLNTVKVFSFCWVFLCICYCGVCVFYLFIRF